VVGLSGEVVSGYVPLVIRALGPGRLWIAGYCNEVDGYVPDATIVAEGGYEARGLVADIGFYSADAEKVLVQAVADLATGGDAIAPAVQRELDAGLFPGAVVLVGRPGKVLYHDAFGFARIVPDKVKMTKDCIFDLASVTKPVATATAFGVCVDERLLRFDMPIRQALPELLGSGIEPITVTQLATHTSGFDNTKYHDRAQGDALLELMLGASPKWTPGSRYYYSCQNLILLGRMVEKASGQRLDEFCRSRIFQPLGMRDTSFGPLPPSSRVAPSGASEIGQIEDAQARIAGRPVGNAGLFSTAADLARFCEMMLGEGRLGEIRVLSPESHRLMTRNLLAPPLPARGFGWELVPQTTCLLRIGVPIDRGPAVAPIGWRFQRLAVQKDGTGPARLGDNGLHFLRNHVRRTVSAFHQGVGLVGQRAGETFSRAVEREPRSERDGRLPQALRRQSPVFARERPRATSLPSWAATSSAASRPFPLPTSTTSCTRDAWSSTMARLGWRWWCATCWPSAAT